MKQPLPSQIAAASLLLKLRDKTDKPIEPYVYQVAYYGLSPASVRYMSDDNAWSDVQEAILKHRRDCTSLQVVWLPRHGGHSSPTDINRCDDCGLMFYNEGLLGQYAPGWEDGDPVEQTRDLTDGEFYDAALCDCCGRRRR